MMKKTIAALFPLTLLLGCTDNYQSIVKLHLNDPDSAVFRNSFKAKRGKDVWCGEVNAKNRMGGMVGFT